ncbi:related to p33ING1b (ING1) protein [Rhynchosporium secalis]|uniref:Chromatin modification-related protein n=1 Tax=Rhynchosporium secalis TaxID=38038 RepID=A0A1E1M7E0_RHYSE|nr:related to p33ING1b (ING1) protein [Rhynchosporium secalis]
MKTSKQPQTDSASSRRAQPPRQTRNNPPRSSISGVRNFGSRGSLGGGMEEAPMEIFPAITHFADAITALPKELVRHFTLLKEVDAKIFAPEEELGRLVEAALNAPLSRPRQPEPHHAPGPTSVPTSAQGSINGSGWNGHAGSVQPAADIEAAIVWDPANIPRRQLFQHCAYTMQNMLVSLDEKNHVISTASEALNKQLARIDECLPYVESEVSEEARNGSLSHWAYPENRQPKVPAGVSRREIAAANSLSAAAQQIADEAAARSDARKQAILEKKKGKNIPAESDFDEERHKEKKPHGNTKGRKVADSVGLGVTNGNGNGNGNPPKRRKVEKAPAGGAVMEKSLSSVLANGTAKGKAASPRETPVPEPKKRARAVATNGQPRKRNNTVTSAMSPSLASSPIRSTFPDIKTKITPPPTNGRPVARGRQNSAQAVVEKRPQSSASNKPNGTNTPDLVAAAAITGRSVPEVKSTMKETANNSKEHLLEDVEQGASGVIGGVVVGNRKDIVAKEDNVEPMSAIQHTTITTKSGRASKPSTPAIMHFPEPIQRSRSSRAAETSNSNKRSHKKGAGQAAQQQLAAHAQHSTNGDDADIVEEDGDEDEDVPIGDDEPTYCYCNNVSYGEMVGCDSDTCEREWFHLECVGLKVAPVGKAKWYCDDCKEKLKQKRFSTR